MKGNPLQRLQALGQSVWLDDLSRTMIESGELARLIADDGISGVTTNPAILHRAITSGHAYDDAIHAAAGGSTGVSLYESLVVDDVADAADLLRPLHQRSSGRDGYVSLEVSPLLARDTVATIAEARRLFARVGRPNVMIKVPGTREGLPAIRALIAGGVNVNATLLFSPQRCAEVAEAWLAGLEDRIAGGGRGDDVHSVASFFVSRIDTAVDRQLAAAGAQEQALRGRAAVACARLAFAQQQRLLASPRWQALRGRGAAPQRLLWASTGTKDPAYADVKYVEALIAPGTVTTIPPDTLAAFREHGDTRPMDGSTDRLEAEARDIRAALARLDIDVEQVAAMLETEGIRKFVEPFEKLLEALEGAREATLKEELSDESRS